MFIVAGIQARTGSTRFPNKVLHIMANGKTMLENVYDRVRSVVPCTFVLPHLADQTLISFCTEQSMAHIKAYEEENNVLARYMEAIKTMSPDYIMRITADCPFIDQMHLAEAIRQATQHRGINGKGVDLVTNVMAPRTTPDGWDVELIRSEVLLSIAEKEDLTNEDREHVTSYIYRNKDRLVEEGMSYVSFGCGVDLSHVKCSVDTPEDMERLDGSTR